MDTFNLYKIFSFYCHLFQTVIVCQSLSQSSEELICICLSCLACLWWLCKAMVPIGAAAPPTGRHHVQRSSTWRLLCISLSSHRDLYDNLLRISEQGHWQREAGRSWKWRMKEKDAAEIFRFRTDSCCVPGPVGLKEGGVVDDEGQEHWKGPQQESWEELGDNWALQQTSLLIYENKEGRIKHNSETI